MPIPKFVMLQVAVAIILAGLAIYPVLEFLPQGALTFAWTAIGISALSGIIAYIIVYRGLEKSIRMFTTYLIGSLTAKLFIGVAVITLVAIKFEEFATVFVLTYFFCYFIFTSFEVYFLLRKLRPISNKGKQESHGEEAHN